MYAGDLEDPQHLLRLFGLEEAAHKRVGHYSKGMKQRLMLARSLLNKPRIWFLDEPTSGLDPASARDVKDIIRAKRDAGVTVFLTTHDMHVADELCDRVAFINEGRIALIDTPRNLKLRFGEKLVRVEHRTAGGQVARENLSLEREADRRRLHELIESQTVETMHSQEATLEDIFIQVTGRGLS
jgi:fluoroquinolone transport system ATP-binding protein